MSDVIPRRRRPFEPGLQVYGSGWALTGEAFSFRRPREVLVTYSHDDVPQMLRRANEAARHGLYVAGFVSYEAGAAFDAAMPQRRADLPLVWMGVYAAPRSEPRQVADFRICRTRFTIDRPAYDGIIARIKEHIHEGDVYQINFTAPLEFDLQGDPLGLFYALLDRQPVSYPAYIDTGDAEIVSCSPELFFRRDGDRVVTRPMKGTARRGAGSDEDDQLEAWLAADAKSRAENLMIVDLLRNDLSRCCEEGSVRVPSLFATERYSTVIQMTSEVEGRLRPGTTTADVFDALFPCGSITGAPKIRAMHLIDALECGPRGVYCGAIGWMHGDRAEFNVAIRTALLRRGRGRLGVGSGIVWDSQPADEYEECLLKARFLTGPAPRPTAHDPRRPSPALRLIETMKADSGTIPLFELHVERIRQSAGALGFVFDERAFRAAVQSATPREGAVKIRATLAGDASLDVRAQALEREKPMWQAVGSDQRIDSSDPYRRHKTSDRGMYDEEYRRAVEAGFDEVVFFNERGEAAEGSRTNIVAVVDGRWITPPVTSGALPGVFRKYLLETMGELEEHVLTLADLRRADELYLCNAVRGLIRAHFALAPESIREDVT